MNASEAAVRPYDMLKVALIACGFALVAGCFASTYTVKSARPSALLAKLSGVPKADARVWEMKGGNNLFGYDVSLRADDARGTIEIDGPADQVKEAEKIIAVFDVKPIQVQVDLKVVSQADKYESNISATIRNNSIWGFDDSSLSVHVTVTPRVNDDGTVTVALMTSAVPTPGGINVVFRAKQGEITRLTLGQEVVFVKGGSGKDEVSYSPKLSRSEAERRLALGDVGGAPIVVEIRAKVLPPKG